MQANMECVYLVALSKLLNFAHCCDYVDTGNAGGVQDSVQAYQKYNSYL